MICIVDYKAGNLRSVQKAVEFNGADARVTFNPDEILNAPKLILPGVGAFGNAMEKIDEFGLREIILEYIATGKPFLGICVGLQLLFESSEESPGAVGLSVLKGSVKRFSNGLKVPHLGWNVLQQDKPSPLWKDIPNDSYYYFAHSYYIDPVDRTDVIAYTDYGGQVPIAVQRENVFGLQFHPEKSQTNGLRVLGNFINL